MKSGAILAVLLLSACGTGLPPVLFDGIKFKAGVDAASDDRRSFVVTVRDGAQNPDAARRAAAFEAVTYCVERFGGSPITWADAPDADPARLITKTGTLVRQGRCDFR